MTQFISRIDENTSLPFKVIVPIISVIVGAAWILSARLNTIEGKQAVLIEKVATIERKIDTLGLAQMEAFSGQKLTNK